MPLDSHRDNQNQEERPQHMLAWMWSGWSTHTLLVGLENGAATSENGSAVPLNVTRKVTIRPCNPLPGRSSRKLKACVHTTPVRVPSSISHKKVDTTPMSIS